MTSAPEERTIYIDLSDLALPAEMRTLDDRAVAASHVYERFTPFADEAWEWLVHPAEMSFDGWVYQQADGRSIIAGANLRSRRASTAPTPHAAHPLHGMPPHRVRQLTERPWTAEPGSKIWRGLH